MGQTIRKFNQGDKNNNEREFRTIEERSYQRQGARDSSREVTSQWSLKALGMSQVKSNEGLSEEIMFKLLRRIVSNESAALSIVFLLPEAL